MSYTFPLISSTMLLVVTVHIILLQFALYNTVTKKGHYYCGYERNCLIKGEESRRISGGAIWRRDCT